MDACEKYRGLLIGLIDNELNPDEAKQINDHLIRCAKCREAYEALSETGQKIGTVSFKEPSDEVLERLWKPPYSRFVKWTGLAMVLGGWLVFLVMAVIEAFRSSSEPFITRIAGGSLLLGLIILLLYVVLERVVLYKSDPYKEVKR